jgi:DNA-3-methyladenine glycosylase I
MAGLNSPEQITPTKLGDYWDVMSKAIFENGISWRVVESERAGTREVSRDCDPKTLIDLPPGEVDAMATDSRIICNRRKVDAIIASARRMLEIEDQYGGSQACLRSNPAFEALVKNLRKNVKFLGDTGAHFMFYVVGEQVSDHTEYMEPRK